MSKSNQKEMAASVAHPLGLIRDTPAVLQAARLQEARVFAAGVLPAAVDLSGSIPAPGDQGSQGSCVGWAVGYAAKSYDQFEERGWPLNQSRYQYSPSWIFNQIEENNCGGSHISDALNLVTRKGADVMRRFPYTDTSCSRQPSASSFEVASRFRAASWFSIAPEVDAFKSNLSKGVPIIIGIEVFPDFSNLSASNPVYDVTTGTSRGGHAITVVGYDDAQNAFRVINSWGTTWGLGGYGWIDYGLITSSSQLNVDAYVMFDAKDTLPDPLDNLLLWHSNPGSLLRTDPYFGSVETYQASVPYVTAMTVMGQSLYAITDRRLMRRNLQTGQITWLSAAGAWPGSAELAQDGENLYLRNGSKLYRVSPLNGVATPLGSENWAQSYSMVYASDRLIVNRGGQLRSVNVATGVSKLIHPDSFLGEVAWAYNRLYASSGAALYAISGTTKTLVSNQAFNSLRAIQGGTAHLFVIANKNLYFIDPANKVEAIGKPGTFDLVRYMASRPGL